jgi:hypothetical protein
VPILTDVPIAAPPLSPLLTAATPQDWLDTHLESHQSAHDEHSEPGPRNWMGVADLLADDAAHLHRMHARMVALDGTPPAAAAKWLAAWFAGGLADAAGFVYATASAALLLEPGAARFRLHAGGWPERVDPDPAAVAVTARHPWAGQAGVQVVADDPELAAAAVATLTAAAEPVVEACRGLARVGRGALWAEVADGFGLPVLHRVDLPVDAAVVERLQQAVRTPFRPWRKVPELRAARTGGGWSYLGRKGGCCLAYLCPVGPEPDATQLDAREQARRERFPPRPDEPRYCSTCSLRDLAGCEERQLFWLEQERLARA